MNAKFPNWIATLWLLLMSVPGFAQTPSFGLYWSSSGPIAGKFCILVSEPADPDGWGNNHLCSDSDVGIRWSFGGPTSSFCVKAEDPSDPMAWDDNYFCASSDLGMEWTHSGHLPVAGSCIRISEPLDHHPPDPDSKPDAWGDNYLCFKKATLVDHAPSGAIDLVNRCFVDGWAVDPDFDEPNEHIDVELYLDGPVGTGIYLDRVRANRPSEPAVGGNGRIRFEYALPTAYCNGAPHQLYAYARGRGPDGQESATRALLSGSPRSFSDQEVVGALDPIILRTVRGWAYDPDRAAAGQSVSIDLYLDGPADSRVGGSRNVGTLLAENLPATLPSEPEAGGNGNVRFEYSLPSEVDSSIHYIYAYARSRRADGSETGIRTLLPGSPQQVGSSPPGTASVRIDSRDGSTFDAGKTLSGYALSAPGATVHALADNWTWSHTVWGEPLYAGELISKKVLSFGSPEQVRQVRDWLLVAPLQPDGQVFAANSRLLHFEGKAFYETNAEFIMMARDYLAFSGNAAVFGTTTNRLVCYRDTTGTLRLASPKDQYTSPVCTATDFSWDEDAYAERIFGPRDGNPGVILGQYFQTEAAFTTLRLPLRGGHGTCSERLKVYVNRGVSTVATAEIPSNTLAGGLGACRRTQQVVLPA